MTTFLSLHDAVARYVENGMSVALEGFTHLIPFRGRSRDNPAAKTRVMLDSDDA